MNVDTCTRCGTHGIRVAYVNHTGRYPNGHRGRIARRALCQSCVQYYIAAYWLSSDDCEMMGPSYTVDGWSAHGLLAARDGLDGSHA